MTRGRAYYPDGRRGEPARLRFKSVAMVVALVGVMSVLSSCSLIFGKNPHPGPSQSATPVTFPSEPSSAPPPISPAPTPTPITLKGRGATNSPPFDLTGGSYLVTYNFQANCFYDAVLTSTAGVLPNTVATSQGAGSGTNHVYDVQAGTYYMAVSTGPAPSCPWIITLSFGL